MDCKTVMAPIRVSLFADDPAGTAIDFMVEKHMGLVPVVDRAGKFVGLLSGDRLMHFMLPPSITMMRGAKRVSYLRESREELQERLDALRQRKVGDLVDPQAKVAHVDSPLADVLMLITEKQYVVPVVDDSNVLLGAISFFSVLHALREAQGETS